MGVVPRDWVFPMAEVWWLLFMVILFLVVRSILLAIVLEAYKDAKSHSVHATTMWGQAYDMMVDIVSGFRGVIRLGDVIKILEKQLLKKARVNMDMILDFYEQNKKLEKNAKLNLERSNVFMLNLIGEYFTFIDHRMPKQEQLRALSAFARISELDGNFLGVTDRIDKLENKFTKIHELLLELNKR